VGSTATVAGPVRAAAPPGGAALADLVADRPHDTLVATVVGPGGTGKTLLLDTLDERYRAAGVPVLRAGPGTPVPGTAPGAVLVDDAHLLDPAALHGLRALAGEDGTRLVLAHRSWPRPAALAAFTAEVGARRHVAVVGHLDRRAVAERLARRSGGPVPDATAAWVHDRSGGLPVLVDLVARTLVDAGLLDVGRRDPGRPERFRPRSGSPCRWPSPNGCATGSTRCRRRCRSCSPHSPTEPRSTTRCSVPCWAADPRSSPTRWRRPAPPACSPRTVG
jgi:hypothetical protein